MGLRPKLHVLWFYYPQININPLIIMKNRFIRVTLVTFVIYIVYTFFFIDEMIDVPSDENNILIENKSIENKIDSIFSDKDSISEVKKK